MTDVLTEVRRLEERTASLLHEIFLVDIELGKRRARALGDVETDDVYLRWRTTAKAAKARLLSEYGVAKKDLGRARQAASSLPPIDPRSKGAMSFHAAERLQGALRAGGFEATMGTCALDTYMVRTVLGHATIEIFAARVVVGEVGNDE